ncbi:fimbrial protein [Pseudomonas chlororaphis]
MDKLLLNGSITTSQCTLPPASKQIEVSMGSVEKRKFNGKGTTSETVPFNIPLNDCEPGSYRPTSHGISSRPVMPIFDSMV